MSSARHHVDVSILRPLWGHRQNDVTRPTFTACCDDGVVSAIVFSAVWNEDCCRRLIVFPLSRRTNVTCSSGIPRSPVFADAWLKCRFCLLLNQHYTLVRNSAVSCLCWSSRQTNVTVTENHAAFSLFVDARYQRHTVLKNSAVSSLCRCVMFCPLPRRNVVNSLLRNVAFLEER